MSRVKAFSHLKYLLGLNFFSIIQKNKNEGCVNLRFSFVVIDVACQALANAKNEGNK